MARRAKLTRDRLDAWVGEQQASLIGRAFSVSVKDRDAFLDWFMRVYEEAVETEPDPCPGCGEHLRRSRDECDRCGWWRDDEEQGDG